MSLQPFWLFAGIAGAEKQTSRHLILGDENYNCLPGSPDLMRRSSAK